jgi:hypothetical protein
LKLPESDHRKPFAIDALFFDTAGNLYITMHLEVFNKKVIIRSDTQDPVVIRQHHAITENAAHQTHIRQSLLPAARSTASAYAHGLWRADDASSPLQFSVMTVSPALLATSTI